MSRSEAHKARNDQSRALFSTLEATSILPATGTMIPARATELGLQHEVEEIPNSKNAKIHWLGDKTAKNVLLYFHGGGFAMPPIDGHIIFLKTCIEQVFEKTQEKLLVAVLEYTLSTVGKYPTQLVQATEALRLVLAKGFKPADVVIGGDSAGGNMSLSLISQILHPHPGVEILTLTQSLAGVLLVSPWVSFSSKFRSFHENTPTDICTPALLDEMVEKFILPKDRNNWSEPYLADIAWWSGFPAKNVLNLWGEIEMLQDPVKEVGEKLLKAGVNVKNIECPLHVHVDCMLDAQSGLEYGLMATQTWDWLAMVCS